MIGFPRFRSSRVLAGTTALYLAVALAQGGSAQETQGGNRRVIDADGFLIDGQPITRNSPIAGGGKLTGKRGDEILLACDNGPVLYVCTGDDCEVSVCAIEGKSIRRREWSFKPRSGDPNGSIVRWLSSLAKRDPKPAAIAAARAMGEPVDAVVLLDEKGVHFAPALAGVLEGSYCLTLGTLPTSGKTWTTTLQWDRRREPEGIATVSGLPPGLYSLRKSPAGAADCQPDANDAGWVLVATSAQFPQLVAEWDVYAASIEELEQSGVSPTLIATLRRAALSGLSEPSR